MNANANALEDVVVDILAERYRAASEKVARGLAQFKTGRKQSKEGRAIWIEGTLDLATVVAEKRIDLPDHVAFSRWCQRYCLDPISSADRSALYGFARDLSAARTMLEESKAATWRGVWEKKPKQAANAAPSMDGRGRISRSQHDASGSSKRKRVTVIPTVMRDDWEPGSIKARVGDSPTKPKRHRQVHAPQPERKAVILKGLTREQVDPDFKGTPLEFTRKYGHVNLHTKAEIEETKRQEALMAWLGTVTDHERTGNAMLAAFAAVDLDALRQWMAKPAKAEKLRAWCNSVKAAYESLP